MDPVIPMVVMWLLSQRKKAPAAPATRAAPAPQALPAAPVHAVPSTVVKAAAVPWPREHAALIPPWVKTGPVRAERQDEEHAMIARERAPFDRSYWRPKRNVGPYVKRAVEMLKAWRKGGIVFDGPRTFKGRVQFRMVQHGSKRAVEVWEPAPPFTA